VDQFREPDDTSLLYFRGSVLLDGEAVAGRRLLAAHLKPIARVVAYRWPTMIVTWVINPRTR
jgi:hypothetical protein